MSESLCKRTLLHLVGPASASPQKHWEGQHGGLFEEASAGGVASNSFRRLLPNRYLLAFQLAIQVSCRADQCEVRQCLGKVAKVLACTSEFLGIQPDMIGLAKRLLKQEPRLLQLSRPRQCLHQPERAGVETAFGTARPSIPACIR